MLACRRLRHFCQVQVRCLSETGAIAIEDTILADRRPPKPYPRWGKWVMGPRRPRQERGVTVTSPLIARMKEFRADCKYGEMTPYKHIMHKHTLDPRQFVLEDEASLEKAKLPDEITREGEERYVGRLILSLKGNSYGSLRSYLIYAKFAAECLDIETSFKEGKLTTGVYTINRSPFIHGKHKDRFKRDIWNRQLILHDLSGTTADVFLAYVQRNIPPGVTMAVTEERILPLDKGFLETYYDNTNSEIRGLNSPQDGEDDIHKEDEMDKEDALDKEDELD